MSSTMDTLQRTDGDGIPEVTPYTSTQSYAFFGGTPRTRPTSSGQTSVTTGNGSAITTGAASAVSTGTASGASSAFSTLLITNSLGSSLGAFRTVANMDTTLNCLVALVTAMDALGTAHNQMKTQVDLMGNSINGNKTQLDNTGILANSLRAALAYTGGLGLILGN